MIYYFSGTGNSYQVAKLLAYLTQDKMQDISTVKDYKHDDSVMGFVFPVHCYDVLDLMQDFILLKSESINPFASLNSENF